MARYAQVNKIQCPYCHCGQSTVFKTIPTEIKWGGKLRTVVRRHRRCRYCKLTWTTVETYESEEQTGLPDMATPPPSSSVEAPPQPSDIAASSPKKSRPGRNPYLG